MSQTSEAPSAANTKQDPVERPVTVEQLISEQPGRTTEELVAAAVAGERRRRQAAGMSGHELDETARMAGVFTQMWLQHLASDGHLVEFDGGWFLTHAIVEDLGFKANEQGQSLTPQDLERLSGLTERQVIKAIDHLEYWAICGGCPEFDWEGWGEPDSDARMTEILGYDWTAKWDEL
ncbi:MAG: hypothetical protein ABSB69_04550 [Solirubrobacteraceae bacterium]|jgi:hypothetical protein